MLQNNLFGIFLKEKRLERIMTLRELSSKAGIAHTYLLNIEIGNKQPPSDYVLVNLAKALDLTGDDKTMFFDLAAQVKQLNNDNNLYIPTDIAEYLNKTNNAKQVIRQADELGRSNEFWNEVLQLLKK